MHQKVAIITNKLCKKYCYLIVIMTNRPCKNPNCKKCSRVYCDNHPKHPEILETYGTIMEEPDFPENRGDLPPIDNFNGPLRNMPETYQNEVNMSATMEPNTNPKMDDVGQGYVPDENYYITDGELLDFLLKKYNLNKQMLVNSILKQKEHKFKFNLLKNFFDKNKKRTNRPIRDLYRFFKEWNYDGPHIGKEEFEDHYEKYIKN